MAVKKTEKSRKVEKNNNLKNKEEICEVVDIVKGKKETEKIFCKEVEKEEKPVAKEEIERERRQLKIVIITMIVIIALFLIIFLLLNASKKFDYNGLKFEKLKQGTVTIYHTQLNMMRLDKILVNYDLYLRNDPHQLESNESNNTKDITIDFVRQNETNLFIDSSLNDCPESNVAMFTLSNFLSSLGMNLKANSLSQMNETFYSGFNERNAFIIQRTNYTESSIKQNGRIYTLNIANCDTNKIVEKFVLMIINSLKPKSQTK
jgi:hypothetical protein